MDWIWEPFIARGALTLLSAYMKVGKSTLAYALISAIAKGQDFCGHKTNKSTVLVLAVEEHQREVVNRAIKFGLGTEDRVLVHVGPLSPSYDNYEGIRKLIADHSIGLVVVDTLSRFWDIEDENDNAMALRALTPLLDLARTTDTAVLLIHHNGKGDSVGGRGIRGASSLFGLIDQALILKTHGEPRSEFRRLEALGRFDATPAEIVIRLNDDTGAYELVESDKEARMETIRHQIKSWLLANPGAHTVASITDALKLKRSTVFKAMATPKDWFTRAGTGHKGDPHMFMGLLPGGVMYELDKLLLQQASDSAYALDLSHLTD